MVKPSHFLIRILVVWFYCVLVAQPNESCQIFAEEPAAQPNVVIVITDDQGYGDLACLGNPILKTPNIDSLFHHSIRLTDYHVAPTCSPTRSALQSGHWTNRTGVWHTIMGRCMLRQNEPTIGQVFQNSGYATGMFGKWHLGDNYPYRPEDRGYNEVLRHGGGGVGQTPDYWDNAYFDGTYWHNGQPTPVKGYCTDVFFDYAKRFIKTQKNAGKPFLAYISTNAPHGPLHAPEEFAKPYYDVEIPNQNKKNQTSNSTPSAAQLRLAHFYGMIANIDSNVGQLRKFLEDESLAENTIFIFTTDNGTAGGRAIYNAGMRGQKGSQYDGGHRVPFFIHWPNGQLSGGKDVKPICHAVDVLPTLINLCNVASPEDVVFDGKDISSLLRGNPSKDIDWNNRILITDSQRVKDPIMWKSSSIMTSKWRLIDGKELYDMDTDSGQKVDVAAAYPAVVRRLRDFYQGWWEELEPTFNQDTAIYLGHPAENPARLTSHDWITTGSTPWNQMQIRLGLDKPQVTGFWNVNVAKAGTYQIRLRRWPKELDRAINAGLEKGDPVPGTKAFRMTPGREFQNLQSASVEISDKKVETTFESDAKEAILTMELPAGKTKLTARFHGPDGYAVGAYYAYVELVEQAEN